jgi:hypothetical protein
VPAILKAAIRLARGIKLSASIPRLACSTCQRQLLLLAAFATTAAT